MPTKPQLEAADDSKGPLRVGDNLPPLHRSSNTHKIFRQRFTDDLILFFAYDPPEPAYCLQ